MNNETMLIKLSGELLNGGKENPYEAERITNLAQRLVDLQKRGVNMVLVIGAGNLWRFRDTQDLGIERIKSDYLGMTAIVMNAVVLNEMILQKGGKSIVFSPTTTQIPNCTSPYSIVDAREAMKNDHIVICSGGVSLPYSTTDFVAVQRALELSCNVVIKVTKVDGLYDKDPLQYTDAKRFEEISYKEALDLQVEVMDHHALALARAQKLSLYICHTDNLDLIGTNDMKGTRVYAV